MIPAVAEDRLGIQLDGSSFGFGLFIGVTEDAGFTIDFNFGPIHGWYRTDTPT